MQVGRPSTSPQPVMTPSAGASTPSIARWAKCGRPWIPSSTKVPSSTRRSIRSRAVSLPRSCCLAIFSSPPPRRALSRASCSCSVSSPSDAVPGSLWSFSLNLSPRRSLRFSRWTVARSDDSCLVALIRDAAPVEPPQPTRPHGLPVRGHLRTQRRAQGRCRSSDRAGRHASGPVGDRPLRLHRKDQAAAGALEEPTGETGSRSDLQGPKTIRGCAGHSPSRLATSTRSGYRRGCADCYFVRDPVPASRLTFDDVTMPESLAPVVEQLEAMVEAHRPFH